MVAAIKSTFEKVVDEGFDQERIEAILHRTELALKTRSNNFGLNLIMALTPSANHAKKEFLKSMRINEKVGRFRKEMSKNPRYLQEKVKAYFVDNPHHVVLSMVPDESFTKTQEEQLEAVRERQLQKLSAEEREQLHAAGKELEDAQSQKDDLSCLPTLRVDDIAANLPKYAIQRSELSGGVPAQLSRQPTNGIAFFRALLSTRDLPENLLPLLPLFTSVLSSMGAGRYDFRQLDTQVDLVTGGLSSSIHVCEMPSNCQMLNESILISSHCLERNADRMFELWAGVFTDLHLNESTMERLKTLIRMHATNSMNGLVYRGHQYAMGSSAASLQAGAAVRESHAGMVALKRIQDLAKMDDLSEVSTKLKAIATSLLNKRRMKVALNAGEGFGNDLLAKSNKFCESISGDFTGFDGSLKDTFNPTDRKQYFSTPFPVNYCSMSLPTVPYTHEDSAALRILARLLSKQFLHTEIREKGGAYGGGAVSSSSGTFSFYSYRDPNTSRTLETFDASAEWIKKTSFTQQNLDEAKLGVFQKVDEPTPPGSRGLREFLSDVDDTTFEQHRQQLKDVTVEDVKRVAEKYLGDRGAKKGLAVIGPEPKAGELDDKWDVLGIA